MLREGQSQGRPVLHHLTAPHGKEERENIEKRDHLREPNASNIGEPIRKAIID